MVCLARFVRNHIRTCNDRIYDANRFLIVPKSRSGKLLGRAFSVSHMPVSGQLRADHHHKSFDFGMDNHSLLPIHAKIWHEPAELHVLLLMLK